MSHGEAYTDLEVECCALAVSLDDFFKRIGALEKKPERTPSAYLSLWKKRQNMKQLYEHRHTIKINNKAKTTTISGADKSLEELSALRLNESKLQTATLSELCANINLIHSDLAAIQNNQHAILYILKDTHNLFAKKLGKEEIHEVTVPK